MAAGRKTMSEEVDLFHKWLNSPSDVLLTDAQIARFETWLTVDELIQQHGMGTSCAKMVALQLDVSNYQAVRLIQQTIAALGYSTRGSRQYFRTYLINEGQKAYQMAIDNGDMASAAKFHANLIKLSGANMADDPLADENKIMPPMIAFVPVREQLEANKISLASMEELDRRMKALHVEDIEALD
jgi:hypothetical protein